MKAQTPHMHKGAFWALGLQWFVQPCAFGAAFQLSLPAHPAAGCAGDMRPSKHSKGQSHSEPQQSRSARSLSLTYSSLMQTVLEPSPCQTLCFSMKHLLFKCTWCYKRMESINQINLEHIGFETCLKWSTNWCVSSTLFIKTAFLMSSCYHNLQSTGQTSAFDYHSFLPKEQGFIKEINHLCTV